jgi:hypothetical protein
MSCHSSGTETYSSLRIIFSVWANAQTQGINEWPRSGKWWCILRNLPDAVSLKTGPSKCFYFFLYSCHCKRWRVFTSSYIFINKVF